jgi:DNA invertase Pin-like site-specific DNA recombinase
MAIPIPAAEYLRVSTEHQQYSLEYQQFVIASYAARNNFVVVKTFADAGKSGLSLKDRMGLSELLSAVVSGNHKFSVVLVYDISRWGRFQDATKELTMNSSAVRPGRLFTIVPRHSRTMGPCPVRL